MLMPDYTMIPPLPSKQRSRIKNVPDIIQLRIIPFEPLTLPLPPPTEDSERMH